MPPAAPLIDTSKAPEPELRRSEIAAERYLSPEFMALEWEHVWTKVWNIAGLESELLRPGSFLTCELGVESLLFCRTEAGEVRGYYNVCQHRGNRLVQKELGRVSSFHCPYHGWKWSPEGELLSVQDPEDFAEGNPCGKLTLAPVRVETWGGFVWFNLDPECVALATFLEPVAQQLNTYAMEKMVRTHHITLEADCNWKVIQDNFQESYHIPTVHPELPYFLDESYRNTQFDLYASGHNRMLMRGGGPGPRGAAAEEGVVLRFMTTELRAWDLDPDDFRGRLGELRGALQRQKRALGAERGFDFSRYVDDQLTDHYHYTLFPNVSLSMKPDGCIFLRGTPHPTDPQKSFFDCWYFTLFPEGRDEYLAASMATTVRRDEAVEHQTGRIGDVFLGGGIDQDASVFLSQQLGLRSRGYRGAYLALQERRVQYYHQVIDEYIDGTRR
jgi:phenylpropionate dioxygenase-like ring-hydroxylating dioxygenase large terminal subunit